MRYEGHLGAIVVDDLPSTDADRIATIFAIPRFLLGERRFIIQWQRRWARAKGVTHCRGRLVTRKNRRA